MKHLWKQINKPVRGAVTIITVTTIGIGIITGVIAWTWNSTVGNLKEADTRVEAKADKALVDVNKLENKVTETQTDVKWIRSAMERNNIKP